MRISSAKDLLYIPFTILTVIYSLINFFVHVTGGFLGMNFIEVRVWLITGGYWVMWPRPFQWNLAGFVVSIILSLIFILVGFWSNFRSNSKDRPAFAWLGIFSFCFLIAACLPTL